MGFNRLRQRSVSRAEAYAVQAMQRAYSTIQVDMNAIFDDPYVLNCVVRSKLLDPSYEQVLVGEFEHAFQNFRGLINQQLALQAQKIKHWTRFAPAVIPVPIVFAMVLLLFSRFSLISGFVRPVQGLVSRELADSRDALVDSERQATLGSLVPVVAHNIRNPLASIRATGQLLDTRVSNSEIEESRSAIIQTADRLERWVSALVSYLHPLQPHNQRISATSLLDATTSLLSTRLAEKSLCLVRDPWDDTLAVEVDPDLMEQAFYALLCNALQASRPGQTIAL
jgi:signal transduction histidine kinase